MVRIARERIADLFALAEREATQGNGRLAGRYVALARRVGMRYNVRLLAEYRELYCRGCSAFWVDGRTVRTRIRSGRRTRTCLLCGRTRRVRLRTPEARSRPDLSEPSPVRRSEAALSAPMDLNDDDAEEDLGPEAE
jgi:ribonuclease P protein subunit RPR2